MVDLLKAEWSAQIDSKGWVNSVGVNWLLSFGKQLKGYSQESEIYHVVQTIFLSTVKKE